MDRLKNLNWWNIFLAILVLATVAMWAHEKLKEPSPTSAILF
jgi:methionine-rich copper-binding protein CopC